MYMLYVKWKSRFLFLPICIYAFGSACPYTIFRLPDADRLIFLFTARGIVPNSKRYILKMIQKKGNGAIRRGKIPAGYDA